MEKAYRRAADILNQADAKCVLNEYPVEHWIAGTEDFWFVKDVENLDRSIGSRYLRYHAEANKTEDLFDHKRLTTAIAPHCEKKPEEQALSLQNVFFNHPNQLYFTLKNCVFEFVYDTDKNALTILHFPLHDPEEVTSPDGKTSLFVKEHNIFSRNNKDGKVTQLTFDGCENLDYCLRFAATSDKLVSETPMKSKPNIVWAPNSRYFITYRTDRRLLGKLHLTQYVSKDGSARPNGVSYPYSIPGDEHILEAQVYVGDAKTAQVQKVDLKGDAITLFLLALWDAQSDQVKWTADTNEAYFVRYDRYFKTIQCIVVNAKTAKAKVVMEETYKTFGFVEYFGSAGQESYSEPSVQYLPHSGELLWHSEIEGWSSLYLYDVKTKKIKMRYTKDGEVFRRLKYVDKATRTIYFTAGGEKEGVDPYFQLLYRADMDSGKRTCLSAEIAEHFIRFSPKGSYYIDTYSTVQTVPVTDLCANGKLLCTLCTADISRIMEKGYIVPEPFEAIGRDGVTKIYGVIIKPYGFDPKKKYPVIDYIYGGAQRINVPKAFQWNQNLGTNPYGGLQCLAQLGFVGIIVDGFATPLRSKAIHDYIFEKAEECCGIEEHVLATKQLAKKYSWIDLDHVGMWGASGGGYATARALLAYPDFYKVGVSMCGNHDQARYHAHWGERWIGKYSKEKYEAQANYTLAKNLQGDLLLIHGDMDDNVHPGATFKLIEALLSENRDFDSLIYPNSMHGVGRFKYSIRKKWDYFVKNLMGKTPPRNFVMTPKDE